MPLRLLTLWPRLKPILPYIAGVGLVLLAYLWAHHRGAEAQSRKDQAQIQGLENALLASNASIVDLKATIATQNAAVSAMAAEGDQRATAATKALSDAQRANTALSGKLADLDKAGSAKPQAGCPSSSAVKAARGSL